MSYRPPHPRASAYGGWRIRLATAALAVVMALCAVTLGVLLERAWG